MQRLMPIQRKCSCGGSCPSCREEEDLRLQRKSSGHPPVSGGVALAHDVTARPGQPLEPSLRADMESHFQTDFSAVRVHTDAAAADASRALGAHAFTSGSHIAFAPGLLANDHHGRGLLAHELTHVIQQSRGEGPSSGIDSGPTDPLEQAADRASIPTAPSVIPPSAGAAIQRRPDNGDPEPSASADAVSDSPNQESGGFLDSALRGVASASIFFPPLAPLAQAATLIKGLYYIWEHREELTEKLLTAIGGYIATVPALAMAKIGEQVVAFGSQAAEAWNCLAGEIGAFLVSLAENWRSSLLEFVADMFLIWRPIGRAIDAISNNFEELLNNISDFDVLGVTDRAVDIMTEVNSVLGVFYLWYALYITVAGAIAGSEVPAAGNAAGGALGFSIAQVLGMALMISVLTTETLRIISGVSDMLENWEDPVLRQQACRKVAEGIFGLVVAIVLFFLGPRIQRFIRSIIQSARTAIIQTVTRGLQRTGGPALAGAGAGGPTVSFRGVPEFEPFPGRTLPPRGLQGPTSPVQTPTLPVETPTPSTRVAPELEPDLSRGVGGGLVAQIHHDQEEDEEPCDEPLPITWPHSLPRPRHDLVIRRGSLEYDGDDRGRHQRIVQQRIAENRNRIPPPCPCFDEDYEISAQYHAHHILPLYLTGKEKFFNLCARQAQEHLQGHADLRYQHDRPGSDPIWIMCDQDDPDIARHSYGQRYRIENYDDLPDPANTCAEEEWEEDE
jgi:hypothetical protein